MDSTAILKIGMCELLIGHMRLDFVGLFWGCYCRGTDKGSSNNFENHKVLKADSKLSAHTLFRFLIISFCFFQIETGSIFGSQHGAAFAQDLPRGSEFSRPDFTLDDIKKRIELAETDSSLSDVQKTTIKENYGLAEQALLSAERNIESKIKFEKSIQDFPENVDTLKTRLIELRAQQPAIRDENVGMTDERLLKYQQDLISKESDLRALRAEISRYEIELQNLITRPVTAREQLAESSESLVALNDELSGLSPQDETTVRFSRRVSLQARIFNVETERAALQAEISGLPARQQVVTLLRDIAQINAQIAEQDVIFLQNQTGLRRVMEAESLRNQSLLSLTGLENAHPLVQSAAVENFKLTENLKAVSIIASGDPKSEAATRRQLVEVEAGLSTAQELIDLGNLNRQSSATLRRVRSKTPSVSKVKASYKKTQSNVNAAIQSRLLLQDQLRNFPIGSLDIPGLYTDWKRENPDGAALTEADISALRSLHNRRRLILSEVSDAAATRAANLASLQTLQSDLVNKTKILTETLNRNLLWLPSIDPISTAWPLKTLRGFEKLFSFENLKTVWTLFIQSIRAHLPIVLLAILAITALVFIRQRLMDDIRSRVSAIGRVQKDSYWHTPLTILMCAIRALPLPLFFALISLLLFLTNNSDIAVLCFTRLFAYLAFFTFTFNLWREWNRDDSLFDAHFGVPDDIRHSVRDQLRWFVPAVAVSTSLIILAPDTQDVDIFEGIGVLGFIVTTILVTIFVYKVLWQGQDDISKYFSRDNVLVRHRRLFFGVLVGLPILGAMLAALGYFDTANELLYRVFLSVQIVVLTSVFHGLTRRTVSVAQRRVALQQAIERREKLVQARKDKEDAEVRGEAAPLPQINYKEIDVDVISRQTSQLLFTITAIAFGVFMWMIWRDLLPALAIFDDIKIGNYSQLASDGAGMEMLSITLWDLLQFGIIILFTIIAAKNLPGFLDIFILNRTKLEAGTKYAVKTVLGYAIIVIGFLMAFDQLGTQWSQLQWVVAALGVGIGFGLQEIIANFISGLIILFERPVRVGDYVTIGDQSGTVARIKIRATTLSDLDNREILIPNKELITGRVTNWTLSNSITRLTVSVGIAYGSDTDAARDIMLNVLKKSDTILNTPSPQVLFTGFGDSSLNFEMRVFLKSFEERWPARHMIHTEVNKELEKAGISIPFPQRDLNIVSQNIPLQVLNEQPKVTPKKPTVKKAPAKKAGSKSKPKMI